MDTWISPLCPSCPWYFISTHTGPFTLFTVYITFFYFWRRGVEKGNVVRMKYHGLYGLYGRNIGLERSANDDERKY